MVKEFGLIGKSLEHSFSPVYFTDKFARLGLDHTYTAFELSDINEFNSLIEKLPNLVGLNVTIPYKTTIIPFLSEMSEEAKAIGAVNTILVTSSGSIGYNTDVIGFEKTLKGLRPQQTNALVLGTGGASNAVVHVLNKMGMEYRLISRKPKGNQLGYAEVNKMMLREYPLIINTTPLGMYPNVEGKPDLPYQFLSERNLLLDLVYEPRVTSFLKEGLQRGARIKNGFEMLIQQAEASWAIWSTPGFFV